MKQLYQQTLPKDLKYQQTTLGIHKDDLCFLYHQKPMSQAASQGQKRSFLLALKLGLAQLIHQTQQEYPILLLDDVFSELDRQRQRQLIEHLPEAMQIFITTTEPVKKEWFQNRPFHLYHVENGSIKEEVQ